MQHEWRNSSIKAAFELAFYQPESLSQLRLRDEGSESERVEIPPRRSHLAQGRNQFVQQLTKGSRGFRRFQRGLEDFRRLQKVSEDFIRLHKVKDGQRRVKKVKEGLRWSKKR